MVPLIVVPALAPVGLAVACTSMGAQVTVSSVETIANTIQEKSLAAIFADDEVRCQRVQTTANELAKHLDSLEPPTLHELILCSDAVSSWELPSCQHVLHCTVRYVPVVSLCTAVLDILSCVHESRCARALVKQCMDEIELENSNVRCVLNMVNKRCDFWDLNRSTAPAVSSIISAPAIL